MNGLLSSGRVSMVRHFRFRRLQRGGGIRRRLLLVLALIVAAIALLPTFVAKTPLRHALLSAVVPSEHLQVRAGAASLGWLRAPSLSAVEVKEKKPSGATLLAVDSIRSDRSLLALLTRRGDLGTIHIVRPTLHVVTRPDGSNLEDALGQLVDDLSELIDDPELDPEKPPVRVAVRLVDGTIAGQDATSGRRWRVEAVALSYDAHTVRGLREMSLSGRLVDAGFHPAVADAAAATDVAPAGQFAVALTVGDDRSQQLSWQVDSLALAAAEPWLRRWIAGAELTGLLVAEGTAAWTPNETSFPVDFTTRGTLRIDGLDATAPPLAGDRLRLARLDLPWRIASQPAGLMVEDLRLESELGRIALRGGLEPASLTQTAASDADWFDAVARHELELRGSVDLAKLAALLPRALGVRDETTITSGEVEFAAHHQPVPGGQLVTAALSTTQLAATSAGRPLRWDEPARAALTLRRENGAVQIDAAECQSEFLQVRASGTPQQFTASAHFDLNRLADRLGQFVDLSGLELAGTGAAELEWNQTGDERFAATGSGKLAELRVTLPDGAVWAEPELTLRAEAAGTLEPLTRQPTRVESGRLQLDAPGDRLDAQLTAAVDLTADAPAWPVAVQATGSIARWLARVRPWLALDAWQVEGHSELTADVRWTDGAAEATDVTLVVTDLRATAPAWTIREPRVELAGDGRWHAASGEIASDSAQFITSTVSLATRDVHYRSGSHAESADSRVVDAAATDSGRLRGAAAFRADLARLAAWRSTGGENPRYQPRGAISGNLAFTQQANEIRGELTVTGQDLSLAPPQPVSVTAQEGDPTIWHEPRLLVTGVLNYHAPADRLALDQLRVESDTLGATIKGQIDQLSATADVNVHGTVDYDLAKITPLLRPYLGDGITLTGTEQARFALAGQLGPRAELEAPAGSPPAVTHWSRRLEAQLEAPWSSASVFGLPFGPGRLVATIRDGEIRFEPLALEVGEGQLTASPHVRLDPAPAELSLPQGPLITRVRISPEVSEAMLKYLAPVLAGTTQSEGLFSLELDGTRVPLAEPRKIEAAGRLTVHSVRVLPGPMVREWIGLAKQVEAIARRREAAQADRGPATLLSIRDQHVNFRVVDGRVYHDPMEFQIDEVAIHSQGSVGLDETLSLVVTVPIQDRWIENRRLLEGLRGESLEIPISGTLSRPRMDNSAVASLSQQLLQTAAQEAVGGELNRALERLFQSR